MFCADFQLNILQCEERGRECFVLSTFQKMAELLRMDSAWGGYDNSGRTQFRISTTKQKTHSKAQKKRQNKNRTVKYSQEWDIECWKCLSLESGRFVWIYIIYPMHTSTQTLRSLMLLYLVNMHGKTNTYVYLYLCVCMCVCMCAHLSELVCVCACVCVYLGMPSNVST